MHPHASIYHHVAIASWAALSPAGNATASRDAVLNRQCHLHVDQTWGWMGRSPGNTDDLARMAVSVAAPPWERAGRPVGRIAVGIGSSKGDIVALLRQFHRPDRLMPALAGACSAHVAGALGIGPHMPCATAAACSTGLACLLAGADLIERGQADAALVGAAEASLTPLILAGFANAGVLCGPTPPQAFAEPTGFAPAEGAAAFVLRPGNGPWRLRAGVRLGDAGHETRFTDPRTLRAALQALWDCCPEPDLIICHATGTAAGDAYELAGLADGPWRDIPRLCCKPWLGHGLGASAGVELALALDSPSRRLWKLSLGFGGHLVAVACER